MNKNLIFVLVALLALVPTTVLADSSESPVEALVNEFWGTTPSPEVIGYYESLYHQKGWSLNEIQAHIVGPYTQTIGTPGPGEKPIVIRIRDDRNMDGWSKSRAASKIQLNFTGSVPYYRDQSERVSSTRSGYLQAGGGTLYVFTSELNTIFEYSGLVNVYFEQDWLNGDEDSTMHSRVEKTLDIGNELHRNSGKRIEITLLRDRAEIAITR